MARRMQHSNGMHYSRTGPCDSWDPCRGERISLLQAGLLSTPEVEPETGYSSVGGMLPYWALPQGFFLTTRHLCPSFDYRVT
jgi:hypothetical protein